MVSLLLALVGCNDFTVQQTVEEVMDTEIKEDTWDSQPQRLDLLLVVDESGSMATEHEMLQKQIPSMLETLEGPDFEDLDWRVGVSGADPTQEGAYGWAYWDDDDPLAKLGTLVAGLDANCSGESLTCEAGIEATVISNIWDDEHRRDADQLAIWISDEPDQGNVSPEYYRTLEVDFADAPFASQSAAIVYTAADDLCWDKAPQVGTGYIDAADLVLSLCEPDTWSQALDLASAHLTDMNGRHKLTWTPADVFDIHVKWGWTELIADDFWYDGLTNEIVFPTPPPAGTRVTATYAVKK